MSKWLKAKMLDSNAFIALGQSFLSAKLARIPALFNLSRRKPRSRDVLCQEVPDRNRQLVQVDHNAENSPSSCTLLAPVSTDRESAIARLRREAKLTSRIDSPNAVTIYNFGKAEPVLLYLAMEHVEGESLADLLARERLLPIDRVLSIANQVARALTAAHSLGIIHRDLKPANIMLARKTGESEVVKVLDFGIAKSVIYDHADNLTRRMYRMCFRDVPPQA